MLAARAPELRSPAGLPAAIWLAVAAGCAALLGAMWDVSWHRTLGRDTFWSAPHLLLYAGVLGGLGAALVGIRTAGANEWGWWVGRCSLPIGYALALVGNAGVVLTAPLDDAWHRLYGRDVDIWSAPHLLALAASAVATIGWITVVQPRLDRGGGWQPRICRAVYFFFLAMLLYTAWFGLNWYHMVAATRDTLTYPSLVGLLMLPPLLAASLTQRQGWPATTAAIAFMGITALPAIGFAAVGWVPPAWPPLLVVPALALDWLTRDRHARGVGAARVALLGVMFAALFLSIEWARVALLPPDTPGPGGPLERRVLAPYLAAAVAHSWTAMSILHALPQVLAASMVGAVGAWLLARVWDRARGDSAPGAAQVTNRAVKQPAEVAATAAPTDASPTK